MRKAQSLTAYIIIGLILLIGFGVLFTLFYQQQEISVEPILYPREVQPLANYVTQCIEQEGAELVKLSASQGGFIDIPPFILFETDSHLTMDDLGLQILPYWTMPGEDRIPPLEYIQRQMMVHISNNTKNCLDSFNAFSSEYEVKELGPLVFEVLMGEENVVFKANYPLAVIHKPSNVQFDINEFVGFVPVRYKQMYELATQVMEHENEFQVVENTTIDIMAADQEIPMDGMTLECGGTNWPLFQIKDRLQRSVAQNLGTVRIKNTNHQPFQMEDSFYEDLRDSHKGLWDDLMQGVPLEESRHKPQFTPDDAWEYFHTYYDVGAKPTQMRVTMDYNPDYGMHLNAQPNDNGVLRTKLVRGAGEFLSFICINNYHFTYDVQYPMRVGIFDPVSNYGRGALFQFAFPVLIDDNTPSRRGLTPTNFPVLEPILDYCDSLGTQEVDIRAKGYYLEGLPSSELKDVEIEMVCVTKQCKLGTTKSDSGVYRLKTHIPECANPLIRAKKDGYVTEEKFLESNFLSLEMTKLKTMDLNVVRHKYRSSVAGDPLIDPLQDGEPLGNNQEVTIYLSDKKTGHNQFKVFPQDETIDIIDDTAAYVLQMIIKDQETVVGGYLTQNITIPYSEVIKGDTLTLHVFEYTPFPRTDEQEANMALYLGRNEYVEQLKPTVK